MRHTSLTNAIAEAERFLRRARHLQSAQRQEPVHSLAAINDHVDGSTPRESGAVKRASMDLSRALADLRQGR